jgi:pimeloyl-ACP methyl ester carboxylesterase
MSEQRISRRALLGAGGALAAGAVLSDAAPSLARAGSNVTSSPQDVEVLLVHGAWADGESWSGVIERLQAGGFKVTAVQLLEQTLSGDVALVRHVIEQARRPLVVAGHSYGGAVISGATAGQPAVKALVFVAAYAPDAGESVLDLNGRFPATPIVKALKFDDQGNAIVDPARFPTLFMPDVPRRRARVLAAAQKPINGAALQEKAAAAGWRTIPSYFQISTEDQVINPELERYLAQRMRAQTFEIASSHASLISHPGQIAALIERAAQKER